MSERASIVVNPWLTVVDPETILATCTRRYRYLHPSQEVTFPVLAALARLSHKYQLYQLLNAVIYRFEDIFPTWLDIWDQRGGVDGDENKLSSAEAIEAVNLFRLIDKPNMIPTALYRCAQLEPRAILRDKTRADGVTREELSPADIELCMEVKEELLKATASLLTRLHEACEARIVHPTHAPSSACCASPGLCVRDLRIVMRRCLEDMRAGLSADPLDMRYMGEVVSAQRDGGLCHVYGNVLEVAYAEERREIWRRLPELTGVDVAYWDSA